MDGSAQRPIGAQQQPQAPLEASIHPKAAVADGKDEEVKGLPKKVKGGEKWDMNTGKEAPAKAGKEEKEKVEVTEEQHKVEVELNGILKQGPSKHIPSPPFCFNKPNGERSKEADVMGHTVIIFSKSYCPFSAKAKHILLEKYTIIPAPYVVELDKHPLGAGLQAHLAKSTGRRTVPNVLINGKSIGGGDEVAALDGSGGLVEKVKKMGGKRILEAKKAT